MNRRYAPGFTLIELMLSMTFISVMLVAIALCVIQLSTIYSRGETLRQVNQASRTLAVDLRRTLGGADVSSIDVSRTASHGRLCTGQYSYIWNTLTSTGTERYPNNRYSNGENFRFIRVADTGGVYCRSNGGNAHINKATAQPVEFLEAGDRTLRVRALDIDGGAAEGTMTGQKLYVLTLTLGTENVQEITASTDQCKPPADIQSNDEYCAVNKFSLTIRAGVR